jgi:hypothetical protein
MSSSPFDDSGKPNYDAIHSLTKQLLHDLAHNGFVSGKTGVIESKCDPTRLCQLAALVGVFDLPYKQNQMSPTTPIPTPTTSVFPPNKGYTIPDNAFPEVIRKPTFEHVRLKPDDDEILY